MVKVHNVKLTIQNNTPFEMTYQDSWFDSGRVGVGYVWPRTIATNKNATIMCYERNWSWAGCSWYVGYAMNGATVTIAFSNPVAGDNKLGVGDHVFKNVSGTELLDL